MEQMDHNHHQFCELPLHFVKCILDDTFQNENYEFSIISPQTSLKLIFMQITAIKIHKHSSIDIADIVFLLTYHTIFYILQQVQKPLQFVLDIHLLA